jgi:hypothetical protein
VLPLAVLLAGYIALGAPLARYIPSLQELVHVAPKEVPLTQAQRERMEREALRKEQEEEFEKAMMEDKVKEAEREAKQAEIDAARREQEEAADAKATAMASYNGRIEAAKGRLTAEPAEGVMLRLRCPDGHQLTRRFATDGVVRSLYDYIDVERYNKASKVVVVARAHTHTHTPFSLSLSLSPSLPPSLSSSTSLPLTYTHAHLYYGLQAPDSEDKLLALANFKYNLVCTMPRLALNDLAMTLEQVRPIPARTHVSVSLHAHTERQTRVCVCDTQIHCCVLHTQMCVCYKYTVVCYTHKCVCVTCTCVCVCVSERERERRRARDLLLVLLLRW